MAKRTAGFPDEEGEDDPRRDFSKRKAKAATIITTNVKAASVPRENITADDPSTNNTGMTEASSESTPGPPFKAKRLPRKQYGKSQVSANSTNISGDAARFARTRRIKKNWDKFHGLHELADSHEELYKQSEEAQGYFWVCFPRDKFSEHLASYTPVMNQVSQMRVWRKYPILYLPPTSTEHGSAPCHDSGRTVMAFVAGSRKNENAPIYRKILKDSEQMSAMLVHQFLQRAQSEQLMPYEWQREEHREDWEDQHGGRMAVQDANRTNRTEL